MIYDNYPLRKMNEERLLKAIQRTRAFQDLIEEVTKSRDIDFIPRCGVDLQYKPKEPEKEIVAIDNGNGHDFTIPVESTISKTDSQVRKAVENVFKKGQFVRNPDGSFTVEFE